jgi:hypothetical protein
MCPKSKSYEECQNDACDIDIFQYTTNGNTYFKNWIIRFDPKAYKIDCQAKDKFGVGTDGFKLVHTITKMLFEGGQGIFISNGAKSRKVGIDERNICCTRRKLYQNRNTEADAVDEISHRKIQFRNVVVNRRSTESKVKKCTSTSLPISADEKCTCHLSIRATTFVATTFL